MSGGDGMGDINWADDHIYTRYVGDSKGGYHEVQVNPGRAGVSLLQDSLNEALNVLEDLLKLGAHEGECTNIDTPEERCDLHWFSTIARLQNAEEFLARFHRPVPVRELTDEESEMI